MGGLNVIEFPSAGRGLNVAKIIDRTGLSTSEFADTFGLDRSSVDFWLSGQGWLNASERALLCLVRADPEAAVRAMRANRAEIELFSAGDRQCDF